MEVRQTREFRSWVEGLKDAAGRLRIERRIAKLRLDDHFGSIRHLGSGVSEMKIDFVPGYRLYYTVRGPAIVLLLIGGDKSTQQRDIIRAQRLATDLD